GPVTSYQPDSSADADADRARRGLETCPVCEYSLRSLPTRHRCPECGFEFDESTEVWRLRRFNLLGFRVFQLLVAVTLAVILIVRMVTQGGRFSGGDIGLGLNLLSYSLPVLLVVLAVRSKPFVAIDRREVLIRLPLERVRHIAWDDILDVDSGWN